MTPRLLRRPEVERLTGMRRSSIYENVANGTFPAPVKIGAKAVAWVEGEVSEWISRKITERSGTVRKLGLELGRSDAPEVNVKEQR